MIMLARAILNLERKGCARFGNRNSRPNHTELLGIVRSYQKTQTLVS